MALKNPEGTPGLLGFSEGYLSIPNSSGLAPATAGSYTFESFVNIPPPLSIIISDLNDELPQPRILFGNGIQYYTLFSLNVGTPTNYTKAISVDIGASTCRVWFDSYELENPLFTADLPPNFNDGNLHHLALVYEKIDPGSGIFHIYVDGIQIDENEIITVPVQTIIHTVGSTTYQFSQAFLTIGGAPGDVPGESTFQGKLTNFRYTTNGALYTSNFTPPTIPLAKNPVIPGSNTPGTTAVFLPILSSNPISNEASNPASVNKIGTINFDTTSNVPKVVLPKCNGQVVNLLTDTNNCGKCGISPDQDEYDNFTGYCCNGIVTPVNIVGGDSANCLGCGTPCNSRTNICCPPTAPNSPYRCVGQNETNCGSCNNFQSCVTLHGSSGRCKDDQCIDLYNKLTCGLLSGTVDQTVDCTILYGENGECHEGLCYDSSSLEHCGSYENDCTVEITGAGTNPSCDAVSQTCFDSYSLPNCGALGNDCSNFSGEGKVATCNPVGEGECYDSNARTTCGPPGAIIDCTTNLASKIPSCISGVCLDTGLVTRCGDSLTNCTTTITSNGSYPACNDSGVCYDANALLTCGINDPVNCNDINFTPDYSGQDVTRGCSNQTCINLNHYETCGISTNYTNCSTGIPKPCLNGTPPTCASANDRTHCGTQNATCGAHLSCLNNGTCATPNDSDHCGVSNAQCTNNQYCNSSGVCTTFDANNCGLFNSACPPYTPCIVDGADTECGNLNDASRCGSLGLTCSASQYCNNIGVCTTFDSANCGSFGNECPAETPNCINTGGTFSCSEFDTVNDELNCGSVGNICPGGASAACVNSQCIDLSSNNSNCGTVGNPCGTGTICCQSSCVSNGNRYSRGPTGGLAGLAPNIPNCGTCGNTCNGSTNNTNYCEDGTCKSGFNPYGGYFFKDWTGFTRIY